MTYLDMVGRIRHGHTVEYTVRGEPQTNIYIIEQLNNGGTCLILAKLLAKHLSENYELTPNITTCDHITNIVMYIAISKPNNKNRHININHLDKTSLNLIKNHKELTHEQMLNHYSVINTLPYIDSLCLIRNQYNIIGRIIKDIQKFKHENLDHH